MSMADKKLASADTLKPSADWEPWKFCEDRSRSIEFVYKNDQTDDEVISRVHFIMDAEYEIADHLKDKVKFAVDRSTHASKLRDYCEWMDGVKKDTLHRNELDQHIFTRLITKYNRYRYWLLLMVILALNILLIVYYHPNSNNPSNNSTIICPVSISYQNGMLNQGFVIEYVTSTFVLGGLFAFLTVWMLLEYFIVTWPHFVLPEFLYDNSYEGEKSKFIWLKRLLPKNKRMKTSVNIFGFETIYLILFLPVAVSPLYCFGYLYCYCFFYIIINNDILQRALQSVTRHWKALVWVAVLLIVILYLYSVVSFIFLRDNFKSSDNIFCERLDECFISVMRFGLIDNFVNTIGVRDSDAARARFFYDVTFFIVVTTVGLNIVFGIILDTFSELRNEKFIAEQDLKSTCFICNLPSYKFDRKSNNGFKRHVDKEHNMWDYIYYSIYLDKIDVTDHNATQKYLYDKISKKSIDYIPFQWAIALKGKGSEDDELKEDVEEIKESVTDISKRVETINQNFTQQFDNLVKILREKKEQ